MIPLFSSARLLDPQLSSTWLQNHHLEFLPNQCKHPADLVILPVLVEKEERPQLLSISQLPSSGAI
jgi:hypothetical protein